MSVVTSTVAKGYFNTGDTPTESNFEDLIDSVPHFGVKVYTAYLTQSGTNAPVATVLGDNTIGVIIWTRVSPGVYTGTLAGAFPSLSKTVCIPLTGQRMQTYEDHFYSIARTSENTVELKTGYPGDDNYDDALADSVYGQGKWIEIRVYP